SAGESALPVTSVGDPAQAIYGWRGASAANLPRFTADFPVGDGGRSRLRRARHYELLTSFRNPPEVLALANGVSEPLRTAGLQVSRLRAREDAGQGDIRCALFDDVVAEREWLADEVARRWYDALEGTGSPPTTAVLVRRRSGMAGIAAALRARELPVEVVGLGGLLEEPEVRDLVSALRVLVDPLAGPAAARLLTGSRWRLGAADLAALWARADELAVAAAATALPEGGPTSTVGGVDVRAALPGEHAEQAGLVDALDDPGERERYSAVGYRRIRRLGRELAWLRRRLEAPLPELVAEVERTMGLDVEAMARPGAVGRAHLDAFAHVVAEYAAASPSASLVALLDYLAVAERAEDGFEPGEVEVAQDRVQLLTVHAAKGLEWQVVAVPQLCAGVFPGPRRSSSWLRTVTELPAELRGDAEDLPQLRISEGWNRKEIEQAFTEHDEEFEARRLLEERRLLYVALTRSEHCLLLSAHWWPESSRGPRGPSGFLLECHAALSADPDLGVIEHWAEPPPEDASNPLAELTRTAHWPVDPLGTRRTAVAEGAALVRDALTDLREATREAGEQPAADPESVDLPPEPPDEDGDPEGWAVDVDVLLAERAAAREHTELITVPDHLSVSQLVELSADPAALAARLRRPLPFPPSQSARRGTAFHAWL
ncbi:MAG: ATP-dependent helicase, partial [Sciscionella sp.]